jgi:hypothetical protein
MKISLTTDFVSDTTLELELEAAIWGQVTPLVL